MLPPAHHLPPFLFVARTLSVLPSTGINLELEYEAIKNSTKQTAWCNVVVRETLRGDITLDENTAHFTVKSGTPGASFVDPWTSGLAQDATSQSARSAVIAAKGHYLPSETVVYSCSARVASEAMVDRVFKKYYVSFAKSANCTVSPFFVAPVLLPLHSLAHFTWYLISLSLSLSLRVCLDDCRVFRGAWMPDRVVVPCVSGCGQG